METAVMAYDAEAMMQAGFVAQMRGVPRDASGDMNWIRGWRKAARIPEPNDCRAEQSLRDGASSLVMHVFNAEAKLRASCCNGAEAAALVSVLGDGSTIRVAIKGIRGLVIVWQEGVEDQAAFDSYEHVKGTVHDRIDSAQKHVATRAQKARAPKKRPS